jgi:hypothetical protein
LTAGGGDRRNMKGKEIIPSLQERRNERHRRGKTYYTDAIGTGRLKPP